MKKVPPYVMVNPDLNATQPEDVMVIQPVDITEADIMEEVTTEVDIMAEGIMVAVTSVAFPWIQYRHQFQPMSQPIIQDMKSTMHGTTPFVSLEAVSYTHLTLPTSDLV